MKSPHPRLKSHWTYQVPVRRNRFRSLYHKHKNLAVETDMSQFLAFDYCADPIPERDILRADFQQYVLEGSYPRMGSGRSGYYRGFYLKGIGRTPLASTWNTLDAYKSTGHMRPSAALEELLVTRYLKARGAIDLIVPCEGLLMGDLDKNLKGSFESYYRIDSKLVRNIDKYYQAITVKPGEFARLSNFAWLADNRFASDNDIEMFFSGFDYYSHMGAESFDENDVRKLVDKIFFSVEKTIKNFYSFVELGVYWTSLRNNFTMDGRFVDLERPLILGAPFIGKLYSAERRYYFNEIDFGFEILFVLAEIYEYLKYIIDRIEGAIKRHFDFSPFWRGFTVDFCDQMKKRMRSEGSPFSKARICSELGHHFEANIGIQSRKRSLLKKYINDLYSFHFGQVMELPTAEMVSLNLKQLRLPKFHRGVEFRLSALSFFDYSGYNYSDANVIDTIMHRLEGLGSMDEFMAETQGYLKMLDSLFRS